MIIEDDIQWDETAPYYLNSKNMIDQQISFQNVIHYNILILH